MKENLKIYFTGLVTGILLLCVAAAVLCITGVLDPSIILRKSQSQDKNTVYDGRTEKELREAGSLIDRYYLNKTDRQKTQDSLVQAMVDSLGDKYADYYDKKEVSRLNEFLTGSYQGIGAYLTENTTEGAVYIISTFKGSPARKAGLKPGDRVIKVNGEDVSGKTVSEVSDLVRAGRAGTSVTLTIQRGKKKKERDIKVVRDKIETDTVASASLPDHVGYIRISSFEEVTVKQFSSALDELKKDGMKRLVIDLRNNGGGVLSSCVSMLDKLLPKELLVYTVDKDKNRKEYRAENADQLDIPITVLVNGNTASASEIFSGALQDYKRAEIIGTQTYGKGIVQSTYEMSDGTIIKFTTSKYYTPKGRCIHGKGITPDVEFKDAEGEQPAFSDSPKKLLKDKCIKKAFDEVKKID